MTSFCELFFLILLLRRDWVSSVFLLYFGLFVLSLKIW
jgi:hypothetical protein